MMKAQGSLATTAQTQQILSVSHVETTEVPVVTEAKAPISPAKAEPAPAVTIEGASPTAVACADNIMRYAAKNKKTKPNCYGKYLAGDVNTTPCLSCAWTNECQQEGKKNSKGDKPQDDKPTCFGKHKGDLDCSMCQFDSECASKS